MEILPFAIFILIFGPLPEELGWRGYALDGLQARYNALISSLILGLIWALWHVPLFFMNGTWQHDKLGFATVDFWTFVFGTVIISILFTWIYNNTNRSTLSAILFHFVINFSGELFSPTEMARLYNLILVTVFSMIVVTIYGHETLTHQQNKVEQMNFTGWKETIKRFLGKGVCPYQISFILDFPLRRLILSPKKLADRLHLRNDSRVLEIGP